MSPRPHRGRRFTNSRRNHTHHDHASDVGTNDSDDQCAELAATDRHEDAPKVAGNVVADPEYVQFADLTPCSLGGCSNQAVPEAWELIDLDTGNEAPGRLCDEHQHAWATRPHHPTVSSDTEQRRAAPDTVPSADTITGPPL
jgi:hypothetical protein